MRDVENTQNPLPWRAERVGAWLQTGAAPIDAKPDDLVRRTSELMTLGFRNFDAFHIACAEFGGADVLATTDDRLLSLARHHATRLRVAVMDVVRLAAEVLS